MFITLLDYVSINLPLLFLIQDIPVMNNKKDLVSLLLDGMKMLETNSQNLLLEILNSLKNTVEINMFILKMLFNKEKFYKEDQLFLTEKIILFLLVLTLLEPLLSLIKRKLKKLYMLMKVLNGLCVLILLNMLEVLKVLTIYILILFHKELELLFTLEILMLLQPLKELLIGLKN